MDDDDDAPQLSAETFAALQEFYSEQQRRQEIFQKLEADNQLKENVHFDENWQLSQFWYDEATIKSLVKVIDSSVPDGGRVALISCPTLFVPLRRKLGDRAEVSLLEFDRRFEVHAPHFVFYDYSAPAALPGALLGACSVVVADPPFLSEECIAKTAASVRLLCRPAARVLVCTGAVMADHVTRELDVSKRRFQPRHANNLANEFACYANFDLDEVLS